jgi:hypothetical protein
MATIDEYIAGLDAPNDVIAAALRAHLDTGLPDAVGQLWHGHPVWMIGKTPVAGFKAFPNHVTFMLWRGQSIDDDTETLVPTGSADMASLTIGDTDGFDGEAVDDWLRQARELAEGG